MESIIGNVYLVNKFFADQQYRWIVLICNSVNMQVLHDGSVLEFIGKPYPPRKTFIDIPNIHLDPNITFLFHPVTDNPLQELKQKFPEYLI